MKNLLLFCFLLTGLTKASAATADSTRTANVGDSVFIAPCTQTLKNFAYIQYYQKNRFSDPNATYNKETGEDFYEYFFSEGDFDVRYLPCSYSGKKYRIISIRVLVDKNTGKDRPVMFLDLGPNTVAWVELNGAVESMEIYFE